MLEILLVSKQKVQAHTSCCRVSGDYGFLIDICCAVVCLQSESIKNIESIDLCKIDTGRDFLGVAFSIIQSLLPLSDVCRDQQQNITG